MSALNRVEPGCANGTLTLRVRYGSVPPRPPRVGRVEPPPGGRTIYKNEDFIRLAIRETNDKRIIWLNTLKATAAYYGWDQAFPTVMAFKKQTSGSPYAFDTGRRGWTNSGGVQLRISRAESRQGWPAGMTNSFRVSKKATLKDIALVAERTAVDFAWITCPHGGRRPREWWEEAAST